jgi:predicted alpha/beta-hydrolase family hydrolase
MTNAELLALEVQSQGAVSAVALIPAQANAAYVFAHGAGAGMAHPHMAALAESLARRQIASLRFQFPFMERGSKRVDPPAVAQAAVRAAVSAANARWPGLPLFAGGKSFGGRMTSQAQAEAPLPGVLGLAFVGFPLHTAGQPATSRATHLAKVELPMLFLQGTRDALAELPLLQRVLASLGAHATLHLEEDADHAFHVRKSSGRQGGQVIESIADAMATWFARVAQA